MKELYCYCKEKIITQINPKFMKCKCGKLGSKKKKNFDKIDIMIEN